MRTKAEFIRELNRAGDDSLATKSWAGDRQDKLFIGKPSFYAFVDMDYFGVLAPVTWIPEFYGSKGITVPFGFVTDFASVPRLLWSLFPPIGRYGYAAVFHDFVYWEQDAITRKEADRVFRDTRPRAIPARERRRSRRARDRRSSARRATRRREHGAHRPVRRRPPRPPRTDRGA